MNPSNNHNNWITIAAVINVIKKPVALYTNHILQHWHVRLCITCRSLKQCTNPTVCKEKKKPGDLCLSCKGWYDKLAQLHGYDDKRQIKWRYNCNTSKWPDDRWEVAKFFMPFLGGNKGTTKDAESTDLSSLVNVLIWMNDVAFRPDRRVDIDLAEKLRSEVRNPWAHAPNQELTDADLSNAFDIANKFVADLYKVFDRDEVKQCVEEINFLQSNKITNIAEAKLRALILLRKELVADVNQMNGEIEKLKEDQSSDRQIIKENEGKVKSLEERVIQLQDIVNVLETERRKQPKSCIPDKTDKIIGRETEVEEIVSSLVENNFGIVSIVGGPGFGKSTAAVEVSHRLRDDHDMIVIFSYLSHVTTVPEVILHLCSDVGVIPGEYPKSSLMFWLTRFDRKAVLVMDNIEQLLEDSMESQLFTKLLVTLRKNSEQRLQILTTTRTRLSIPGTKNVQISELDEKSSLELLGTYCFNKEVKGGCLTELANLCGFHPLALCIAGSQIPDLDNLAELIEWLRETPMDVLDKCSQAIEFSFKKLSDEDKKALVRLSVFHGNFQRNSAEEVIERRGFKAQRFLKNLVNRSLLQSSSNMRFVIHSLIRRFLADHEQLQDERKTGERFMVEHFLKVCHSLTIDSYSKNGFTTARKLLKKDGHNVEETLKICSQNEATNLNPNVVESLASSHIYKSSSRFFYNFCWDLLPLSVLRNFHESCLKLAENRKQIPIQITFQCLVADQEGRKSAWKSPEYINKMEAIKDAFDENNAVLKEDRYLYDYCYYFYARYYSNIPKNEPYPDLQVDDIAPPSSRNKDRNSLENLDETLVLIERGHLNKKRATKAFREDKEKYKGYMKRAESFYNQALSSAKNMLGDHELTSICHKVLGDLYFTWRKNEEALTCYSDAIELRKNLKLDSNEPFVYLLKNYGSCLSLLRRFDESIEKLNEARDIADKLAENHTPCRANVYYELAKTCRCWKPDCQEAAKYADAAMEMQGLLDQRSVKTLEDIIEIARKKVQQ